MSTTYEPSDEDLIRWVGTWTTEEDVNRAGYHFGVDRPGWTPVVGEVVVIHSHGRFRRGIVVSVGRTNAKVALTTETAIRDSRKGFELTRVNGKSVRFSMIAGVTGPAELVDGTFYPATVVSDEPTTTAPVAADSEPADVCGCDRNPLGHSQADHPTLIDTEPGASEPEPAEQASPGTVVTVAGSEVVKALEAVWEQIRERHPELPEVVIITGSALIGVPRWGHFRADSWEARAAEHSGGALEVRNRHAELFVAGERLAVGAAETVQTMLHEAAHALARVREIKDTSRQSRWHNRAFLALAQELGLQYAGQRAVNAKPGYIADPSTGFSDVDLTDDTRQAYASAIEQLDRALVAHLTLPEVLRGAASKGGETVPRGARGVHDGEQGEKQDRNNRKVTCECDPPRIIRVSRAVLELGSINCGLCGGPFTPEE